MSASYATSTSAVAVLKELYIDDQSFVKDLVYPRTPPSRSCPRTSRRKGSKASTSRSRSSTGSPRVVRTRSRTLRGNQTPNAYNSFFVYVIQDYQLITITNLLIEQTQSNAGAFVDEMKREMDGGIRNLSNNVAFELFQSGTATRGQTTGALSSVSGSTYTLTLANAQSVVNFEVGMTIQASATDGGAIIPTSTPTVPDLAQITAVNRSTGVITVLETQGAPHTNWLTGSYLTVQGDIPAAGGSGSGPLGQTGSYLAATGLAGWLPSTDPASNDSFWGVNRSADPTRLGGLRYDASAYSIEEGLVNALGFGNREGADPDMIVLPFTSYTALENALGAKVQYVDVHHDEADIAFEGIRFHSAYGYLTVMADRSMIPSRAFVLTVDSWKMRSLGKIPHILTYGMEGLEGLRVGTADSLEVRAGCYYNDTCNAPGWSMTVALSQ
jgi:hypothetical protein